MQNGIEFECDHDLMVEATTKGLGKPFQQRGYYYDCGQYTIKISEDHSEKRNVVLVVNTTDYTYALKLQKEIVDENTGDITRQFLIFRSNYGEPVKPEESMDKD